MFVNVCVCLYLCTEGFWADMVLLYNVAFHRFWEGLYLTTKKTYTLPLTPFFLFEIQVEGHFSPWITDIDN